MSLPNRKGLSELLIDFSSLFSYYFPPNFMPNFTKSISQTPYKNCQLFMQNQSAIYPEIFKYLESFYFKMQMSDIVFSTEDKNKRKIKLTTKQWKHISYRHPEMADKINEIESAIISPTVQKQYSEEVIKYYKYLKSEKKYLMVAVKLLNSEGFIITAYLTSKIQNETKKNNP